MMTSSWKVFLEPLYDPKPKATINEWVYLSLYLRQRNTPISLGRQQNNGLI